MDDIVAYFETLSSQ